MRGNKEQSWGGPVGGEGVEGATFSEQNTNNNKKAHKKPPFFYIEE